MKSILYSLSDAQNLISNGFKGIVAADEKLLKQLPNGDWIGGTMPYFMSEEGGTVTKEKVLMSQLDPQIEINHINTYAEEELDKIFDEYPEWGVSFIIIPGLSNCAERYPTVVENNPKAFISPIMGWASGVLWEEVTEMTAKIIDGREGSLYNERVIVMHCDLPESITPQVGTINIIEPTGPKIRFPEYSRELSDAIIDGKKGNIYDYIKSRDSSIAQAFVTNIRGEVINMSIKSINDDTKTISVWNPANPDYEYQHSDPIDNYEERFEQELKKLGGGISYNCNCLYNFLFGNLNGKKIGDITGIITFGEIAYLSLNQTFVYLTLNND